MCYMLMLDTLWGLIGLVFPATSTLLLLSDISVCLFVRMPVCMLDLAFLII